ncbi:MAG TPA: HEAT repeat domain-containing protein [Woeseiaceae bacterium]|nr:HEAT repeat domain-containing protein [Woeseiaceae bacterium]
MTRTRAAEFAGAAYLTVIAALLLSGATCVAGEDISVSVDGDLVAVTASEAPLREVLEEIAGQCGLQLHSSNALARRVTLHGNPMPVEELLRRLLREESYLLLGSEADDLRRLWIFSGGDGEGELVVVPDDRRLALDHAIAAMSDPDAEVREEAVLSLGDIEGADVAPLLTQALADDATSVREAAAALLEDMGF